MGRKGRLSGHHAYEVTIDTPTWEVRCYSEMWKFLLTPQSRSGKLAQIRRSRLQVHLAQQGVVARVGAEGKAGKQAQIRGFNSSISPNYLNREPVDSEQYINC